MVARPKSVESNPLLYAKSTGVSKPGALAGGSGRRIFKSLLHASRERVILQDPSNIAEKFMKTRWLLFVLMLTLAAPLALAD